MTTPLAAAGAYAADKGSQAARKGARDLGRARLPTGNRQYQGVILAEFLVAVLIVALAPVARGKQQESTAFPGSGPSPYGVDDIKQLVGIGAVYFILALLSSGKYGRLSAWFGGLVLVAIGLAQTQTGGLAGIFGIFQPAKLSAGSDSGSTAGITAPGVGAAIAQSQQQFGQVPDATGSFPVIGQPGPSGSPTFQQELITGNQTIAYLGGPGVVTTNPLTGGSGPVLA